MTSEASAEGARVLACDSPDFEALLAGLGIECARVPPETAFVLCQRDGALDLRPPGERGRPGIQPVFPPDGAAPGREGSRKKNPLLRAFGPRIDVIFDLTAGLGGDSYRLAAAGHRVRACERDPVVFALLTTAWQRDRAAGRVPRSVAERLAFEHAEAEDVIAGIEGHDVGVYIDPMYPPPRRSSAKPRRALQVLRQLLGSDTDSALLVEAARARAARVVVKRPHHAAPLLPGASFEIESKLVRFDVYVNPSRMSERASDEAGLGREGASA